MMGEDTESVLAGRVDRVAMCIWPIPADGRARTGTLDWQHRLDWLAAEGYAGYVGLEYRPSRATIETLAFLR